MRTRAHDHGDVAKQARDRAGQKDLPSKEHSEDCSVTISTHPHLVAVSETKLVRWLRLLLLSLLLIINILVSLAVYRITRQDEQARFEQHVQASSQQIIHALHTNVAQTIGGNHSLVGHGHDKLCTIHQSNISHGYHAAF